MAEELELLIETLNGLLQLLVLVPLCQESLCQARVDLCCCVDALLFLGRPEEDRVNDPLLVSQVTVPHVLLERQAFEVFLGRARVFRGRRL